MNEEFLDRDERSPELEELGYAMLGWKDGLVKRADNESLSEIIAYLLSVQYDKEGSYGSSWCARGEHRGIMSNIDRKYDRLDKILEDERIGARATLPTGLHLHSEDKSQIGESKIDAVADLANYCLLYMTWLRKQHPGAFKVWIDKNVPSYAQDKIPFIQKYYEEYKENGN